jgi:hypothetical protein
VDGNVEYLPASWSLDYRFAGQTVLTASGVANTQGTGWTLTLTAAQTAQLLPGVYSFQAYVTKSTERYTVFEGTITVRQNLATTAAGYEARSTARVWLDQIEKALSDWSKDPYAEYEIAGRRQVWRLEELLHLRSKAQWEVKREEKAERIKQGLGGGGKILTRFT